MKRALVYIDPDAPIASLELLNVLELMYGANGYVAHALAIGEPTDVSNLIGAVDTIVRVDRETVGPYDVENVVSTICELHREQQYDAIVILSTTIGRMVAPRVAMRLHVGLVADVTEIRRSGNATGAPAGGNATGGNDPGGNAAGATAVSATAAGGDDPGGNAFELVRPAFSGRMLAAVVCRGDGPTMFTVRRNTFDHETIRRDRSTTELVFSPQAVKPPRIRLLSTREKTDSYDIRESDVLVSGGGGVMRHFDQLETLATHLRGRVSASRRVVDSGKAPRHIQVGQSGKTVSPRLYLAIGISGSIQHVVGLKNAEYVIAVNSDRRAPICSLSDVVVEGDARTFITRIIERIERDGAVPPDPSDIKQPNRSTHGGAQ